MSKQDDIKNVMGRTWINFTSLVNFLKKLLNYGYEKPTVMSTLCLHCYLRYISGFLATQHSAQVQPTPVEFTSFKQSKSITNS